MSSGLINQSIPAPEAMATDDTLVRPLPSVYPHMPPQIFLLGKHAATEVAGTRHVGPVVAVAGRSTGGGRCQRLIS